ncbi:MAG: hypothetical protein IJ422_06025 [Oscillospiraceae bacterium]|nr:hypothetical protein [Oscillospiraceae bacterium]
MKRWGIVSVLVLLAGVICFWGAKAIRWGQLLALAVEYNHHIAAGKMPGDYEALAADGKLARLEIPSCHAQLDIYIDGTGAVDGLGHLRSSALPIGGKGNHTVLTADTLPELREGDLFYIRIYGMRLAYRVEQITYARTYTLMPESEADLCTLVAGGAVVQARRVMTREIPTWPILFIPAVLAAALLPLRKKQADKCI